MVLSSYLPSSSSKRALTGATSHFKVFDEFRNSSYAKRYEHFCRRLVLERHYDSAAFLLSGSNTGLKGDYVEPASDLAFEKLAKSLVAQTAAFSGRIKEL